MLAAQGGHTETVKALIEAGADVNLINRVSLGIYAVLIVVLLLVSYSSLEGQPYCWLLELGILEQLKH